MRLSIPFILLSVFLLSLPQKSTYRDLNKNGRMDVYENPKAAIEARVEDLLSQMTLEEKTCQTATLYGYKRVLQDELPTANWKNEIWKDGIANIDEHLNGWGQGAKSVYATDIEKHVWAMNEVQRFFVEQTRLGIPVDFTNEGLRGVAFTNATSFPSQLGLGHTWDTELVYEVGRITAREARALGYTNIYAPTLDVTRDQRWGRVEDTYGEDPYLASRLGVEMVLGLQEDYTVAATAKHFAAYSASKGARGGEARVDPQVSAREIENIFLPPFEAAVVEAGLLGIMSSYNDVDGIPVTGSGYWLTQRLRKGWGFKGYVVSDSGAVEHLYSKHGVAENMKEAVRQSIEAGLNVKTNFTRPEDFILPLRELVKERKVSMKTLNDRVRDVLRVKFLLGLFDRPYITDAKRTLQLVNSAEHRRVALRAARESIVLLKNDQNVLPLSKQMKSIAVIGPNADDPSLARYRYGPSAVESITVLQGIKDLLGAGVQVNYAKGCEVVDERWPESEVLPEPLTATEQAGIAEAVEAVKRSEMAIIVLGDSRRTVGESLSRTSLDLPGRQLDLVKAVHAAGKPVVVVLLSGRPLSINWVNKYVPAIVEGWFPGAQGGTAIAEVLFGDHNPSGKLTVTFLKTAGQIPFNFPTKPNAQWEGEKSRVNGALYYFGHGLSYTTFAYSNLKVSAPKQGLGYVDVSFEVQNTGTREGTEIVQLYLRDLVSSVTTYEKNLRGFARVTLWPGATRTIKFTLTPADLSFVSRDMQFVVEPGTFRVMVGSSSEDIRLKGDFELSLAQR